MQPEIVQQAITALKINVPIYRAEVKGNTVTLFLYGHLEPVTYTRPSDKAEKVSATKRRGAIPAPSSRKESSK